MIKDKNSLVREILDDYKVYAERDDVSKRNPEKSFIFDYFSKWFGKQTDAEMQDEVQVQEFIKKVKSLIEKLDNGKKAIDFKVDFKPNKASKYKKKNKFVTVDMLRQLYEKRIISDEEYVKIFFGIFRTEARRHKTKETLYEWIVHKTGLSSYTEIAKYIKDSGMLDDLLNKEVFVKIKSFFRANGIEEEEIENSDKDINEKKTTQIKKDKDYTYIDDVGIYHEFCNYRKIALEEERVSDSRNNVYIEDWDCWDSMYRYFRKGPMDYELVRFPLGMNQDLGVSIYILGRKWVEKMLNESSQNDISVKSYICFMYMYDSFDYDETAITKGDIEFKYAGDGFLSYRDDDQCPFRIEIFDSTKKAIKRYDALKENADREFGLLSTYRDYNWAGMPDAARGTRYEKYFEEDINRPLTIDETNTNDRFDKNERDFKNKLDKDKLKKIDKTK